MTLGDRSPVMSNKALVPPFPLIYDLRYISVDARTFLVGIGTEEYRTGKARNIVPGIEGATK